MIIITVTVILTVTVIKIIIGISNGTVQCKDKGTFLPAKLTYNIPHPLKFWVYL